MAIGLPCRRIGVDVTGYVFESALIAYYVFVIAALPCEFKAARSALSCDVTFHLTYNYTEPTVEVMWPCVLWLMPPGLQASFRYWGVVTPAFFDIYDQMDVVRHHHVVGQPGVMTHVLYASDGIIDNLADCLQMHFAIDNSSEIMSVAMRADGDEIQTIVIIVP